MREFLDYDNWVGSHTLNEGSLTSQTQFLNEKEGKLSPSTHLSSRASRASRLQVQWGWLPRAHVQQQKVIQDTGSDDWQVRQ